MRQRDCWNSESGCVRRSVELAQGIALDPQRLAQEVAVLADRLDVSEEISRFHSHLAAFRATLHGTTGVADGVGKRLGRADRERRATRLREY